MPIQNEEQIIDFSKDQMFDLVANIDSYSDFLPWCDKSHIISRQTDDNGNLKYDRIIIDTAPTGHTLRLMQLPDFLNSVTSKLISFRSKIMGAVNSFKSLFNGGQSDPTVQSQEAMVDEALEKLEDFKERLFNIKAVRLLSYYYYYYC